MNFAGNHVMFVVYHVETTVLLGKTEGYETERAAKAALGARRTGRRSPKPKNQVQCPIF